MKTNNSLSLNNCSNIGQSRTINNDDIDFESLFAHGSNI